MNDTIQDWVSIALHFISSIAWPLIIALSLFLFRNHISTLLGSLEEFEGFGIKGKLQKGNSRAEMLRDETSEGDLHPSVTAHPSTANDVSQNDLGDKREVTAQRVENGPDHRDLIVHYTSIAIDRLRNSKYNTTTTSLKLGAEIVGSSYADLKQALRFFNFVTQGDSTPGETLSTMQNLGNLKLSADLTSDIKDARRFADDVTRKVESVDGRGAGAYIDSIANLIQRTKTELLARIK